MIYGNRSMRALGMCRRSFRRVCVSWRGRLDVPVRLKSCVHAKRVMRWRYEWGKKLKKMRVAVLIVCMGGFRIHDTRSSLLGRVKNVDDDESWCAFYSIYTKLIRSQALRAGLRACEAEDVVQETMIEVSNRLQSFHYDRQAGSFRAWLFQLARWRITNEFQKRARDLSIESIVPDEKNASDMSALTSPLATGPEESWDREWQQAVFDAALNSLRRKWPPKKYQAIALLLVNQWSVPQTCKVLRMTRTHLYVLRFRALHQLKKEVVRLKNRTEKGLAL